ncbi:MAG: amidohydrolase family protein [Candidatus Binatia bacterium]
MDVKFGLFSCDSHAQVDRDAWTKRMSKAQWGDRIPRVVEVKEDGSGHPVDRWTIDGKIRSGWVCNCPAAMEGGVERGYYPVRWEEVPKIVYDPAERLKALDHDRVDGEVLFPNTPVANFAFLQADSAFELACVQAHNDALAEWREVSDRYVPLAIIPYLTDIDIIVAEVERAVKKGHRGIVMLAEPSLTKQGLRHFNDPFWEPLWACCQDLGVPVHWHGSAGLADQLSLPRWKGFTKQESHTVSTSRLCATPAQLIPNLIFSGILDRYPRLKWACAETGLGWVNYVLEACDHEWERRHLWNEDIKTKPSEVFRRQIFVDFWYEKAGIELRHNVGVDQIMWESDYPHIAATYPKSWRFVEETLVDVPESERKQMLYENAMKLYGLV